MAYDPCGTQKLDGDQIIKRLAESIGFSPAELTEALRTICLREEMRMAIVKASTPKGAA